MVVGAPGDQRDFDARLDAPTQTLHVTAAARRLLPELLEAAGYDGEVYLVDLQAHNEVVVERRTGQRCTVRFDFKAKPGDIPTIGPLVCREAAP